MAEPRSTIRPTFDARGFFGLRTALLPFDTLLNWVDGSTAHHSETDEANTARAKDRLQLVQRLRRIVARPEVREALYIASESTSNELDSWLRADDVHDTRLEQTLARYVQRMAGRATPFGLFAGCSVGRIGSTTHLHTSSLLSYQRYARLDNACIFAITTYLRNRDDVRAVLRFRPNSSLYRLGTRWRYVQQIVEGHTWRYSLVALDGDEYLDVVLADARRGATIDALAKTLVDADPDGDISHGDALAHIDTLVEWQVLVSDLLPLITGRDSLADILSQLQVLGCATDAIDLIQGIRNSLGEINSSPLGINTNLYTVIKSRLKAWGIIPHESRYFQVDLVKPAPTAECSTLVIDSILTAVEALRRIAPPFHNEPLERFKAAFALRYDEREVPLCEALDEESGIGFDRSTAPSAENAPLLNALPFTRPSSGAMPSWTASEAFLLTVLVPIWASGRQVLTLTDSDLQHLATDAPLPLPDAFSVVAVAALDAARPAGIRVLFRGTSGPSGANLLGRFCHADATLADYVSAYLAEEELLQPNVIFAEVVHLPEGRLGNILARPVLRDYEIPYLGRSGARDVNQIPVSDLLVSIRQNNVVLRSLAHNREVLPRMTAAHNFSRGQGMYNFLCSLQLQNVTPELRWNWRALEHAPFLPRVEYRDVVLSRARWRLERDTLQSFSGATQQDATSSLLEWRERQRVPRFVMLADGDHELPIDFDNVLSIEAFLRLATKRSSVVLFEMFPAPGELCAQSDEGRYVHEIVVPFLRRSPPDTRPSIEYRLRVPSSERTFLPGSSWLYLKWYCGTAAIDSVVQDLVNALIDTSSIVNSEDTRWFFVRYGDPDWHLRLRIRCENARSRAALLEAAHELTRRLFDERRMWRLQVDTYVRETERYGGASGMLLAEELFWHDSRSAVDILRLVSGDAGLEVRSRLCLLSWDLILSDLGFDLPRKHKIVSQLRDGFAAEFASPKALKRAIADRFRRDRTELEAILERRERVGLVFEATERLRARSVNLRPVVRKIRKAAEEGRLSCPLEQLADSYMHMSANRILRSSHRPQEFVLMDFLSRLYGAQLALAGTDNAPSSRQ